MVALLVGEIALACTLLVGATLLVLALVFGAGLAALLTAFPLPILAGSMLMMYGSRFVKDDIQLMVEELDEEQLEIRKSMLETDPPRHTQLRAICSKRPAPEPNRKPPRRQPRGLPKATTRDRVPCVSNYAAGWHSTATLGTAGSSWPMSSRSVSAASSWLEVPKITQKVRNDPGGESARYAAGPSAASDTGTIRSPGSPISSPNTAPSSRPAAASA